MIGKQAKVLSPGDLRRLMTVARRGRQPERDRVMVLLAMRAGLRACEIAGLTWAMVLDANGRISQMIEVRRVHRQARQRPPRTDASRAGRALLKLRAQLPPSEATPEAAVLRSLKGGALRANSVVNWFILKARAAGLEGCSSHSGRRTFITKAARAAHRAGASLRDVQMLAGHRSIETTQGYIDGDSRAQRRLVSMI